MSEAIESAYFEKDLPRFKLAVADAAARNEVDTEYSNDDINKEWAFPKGSALTSIVSLAPYDGDSLPFVEALLDAGANPNKQNVTLNGLTVLGNLLAHSEPYYYLATANKEDFFKNLHDLLALLLSYGLDYNEGDISEGVTSRVFGDLINGYLQFIKGSPDVKSIHEKLCQDLSKENNLKELRILASGIGLPSTGKKAELCSAIASYALTHAVTEDPNFVVPTWAS